MIWLLFVLLAGTAVAADTQWQFDGWEGPAITVHMSVPEAATDTTAIVIVMHGWSREAERYFADWKALGEKQQFIVVVPHFPVKDFPSSNDYNLGHVFDAESGTIRPRQRWTFSAIEMLFDAVVARLGGSQTGYTLFGHSAGSQFVHRFLYFMPDARVQRYLAANAGWYTMPDFDIEYPYGLAGAAIDKDRLIAAFGEDLVLMLGREDLDHTDPDLRNTPEARRQGRNRLARGLTFFDAAKATAEKLGVELNWRLVVVDDAGHVNAQMATAAAEFVE